MEQAIDKTVLVVDDEPNVREYLTMILQDAGFTVVTAGDGLEALEVVRREQMIRESFDRGFVYRAPLETPYESVQASLRARTPYG